MSAIYRAVLDVASGEFEELADRCEEIMKGETHSSGALRDSITQEQESKTTIVVGVDSDRLKNDSRNKSGYDYSEVVRYGRKGGKIITPKKASVLKYDWKGKTHYSKSVKQGGFKGNDFIQKTIEKL